MAILKDTRGYVMLSKPEKPAFSTGHRKIIAGITLFWAGVVCAIITIIMLVIGFYHLNSVEEGVLIYAGFIMLF
ncbi:MAG: hypothetical protein WC333_03805, partial [Dehalococcoidia bacterium]